MVAPSKCALIMRCVEEREEEKRTMIRSGKGDGAVKTLVDPLSNSSAFLAFETILRFLIACCSYFGNG